MTTLTKTYRPAATLHKHSTLKDKYTLFLEKLSFGYFGFISFTLSVSAILGGAVVKFSLENHAPFWHFALGMLFSLLNIVVAIGQFPVKWVFMVFAFTTLVNVALILLSFLSLFA